MASSPDNPHIVIHGAGSVGCLIGGTWMLSGVPVSFYGRQSVKDEIAENGLTVTDSERRRIEARPDEVDFSTEAKVLARGDIIALCVKSTGTEQAAKEIARHARKGAVVISFQNGVSNDRSPPAIRASCGGAVQRCARDKGTRARRARSGWDHPAARAGGAGSAAAPVRQMRGVAWESCDQPQHDQRPVRPLLELSSAIIAALPPAGRGEILRRPDEPVQIGPIRPSCCRIASPDLMFRNTIY